MSAAIRSDSKATASTNGEALYEVVNGQRVEMPLIGIYALLLASELYLALGAFVKQHRLGRAVVEGLFILDAVADLRRRPDVAFVSAERWPLDKAVPETGDWAVVPDLAVEVISPNDLFEDVQAKLGEYFAHGVRQVWVVGPKERQVYVYDAPTAVRILTDAEALTTALLPGFSLNLGELFQKPA